MENSKKRLELNHYYDAAPDVVFDAWLDPDNAGKWLYSTVDGEMQKVEIDPQVGGKYTITEKRGEIVVEHYGTYLEIEKGEKIVFTFAVVGADEETIVTVNFNKKDHGCMMTFVHELRGGWVGVYDAMHDGWKDIFNNLENYLK